MQRRNFIKNSGMAGLGLGLTGISLSALVNKSSKDKIVIAVLGTNGRGLAHINAYTNIPGVEVAYICDVEEHALAKGVNLTERNTGKRPKAIKDFRTILDNKDIDAISIATPDHWHALAAILGCTAGKHVYVEKPCGHNPAEGEMIIAAANKYNRLVQMGSQRRSWPNLIEAMKDVHDGIIGNVYFAKGWYANHRESIGHGKDLPVPSTLDWQLWQGPAPHTAYQDNVVPYNWHWFWNWGTGEACNNGAHEIDCMRWALQVEYPEKVVSSGGRYAYKDDWQTTDTQVMSYEFPEQKTISWEGRSCNKYPEAGSGRGFKLYGKEGTLVNTGGDDYKIFDKQNKIIKESKQEQKTDTLNTQGPGKELDAYHFKNFIDAVREGVPLNAPIIEGHKSVLLCHLGNIAQRTGHTLHCDPANGGKILNDKDALELWGRKYQDGWTPKV